MPDRLARPALAVLFALAVSAAPAAAHTHRHAPPAHHATRQHEKSRRETSGHATKHDTKSRHVGRATGKAKRAEPAERRGASPAGVTGVPAGGLKVYCPARRSPLLIRKSTQGAGTTVTVVCR